MQHVGSRERADDYPAHITTLLRMAARVSRIAAWWLDLGPEPRLHWSDEMDEILDLSPETVPDAADALAFYAPEHREIVRTAMDACIRAGESIDLQVQVLAPAGSRTWVRCIGEAVRDETGRIVRVQGILQDISSQKATEESLESSQRRLWQLADAMPFIVWTATPDGTMDRANSQFYDYTGAPREGAINDHWPSCVHPDDLERLLSAWTECVRERKVYEIEYRFRRGPDGAYRWFRAQAQPAWDPEGRLLNWYGTGIDIHETKRLELEATRFADRLTTTLESITDAFLTLDHEWRVSYVNAEAERLLQRPRCELLGHGVWSLLPEPLGSRFEREARRAVREGCPVSFEAYHSALEIWTEVRVYPSVEGLAVHLRDVTERYLSREALHESEERFRLLAKATNDAIWDWDLVTDDLWWGEGFESLFGFDRDEIEPTIDSWINRIHPDDKPAAVADVQRAIDSGAEAWVGEYRFVRHDGTYARVIDRGQIIRDAEGRGVRMVGGMTDVSEQRLIEEQMRDQATLLDHAQDAIFVQDLDHRISYWNHGAERVFGWSRDEALGQRLDGLLGLESKVLDAHTQEVLERGSSTGELGLFSRLGERRTVASRWSVLRSESGEPRGVLVINTDVTQQKAIESQLLRAQRLESIGTLAGGIAHDLNNVLTPILSALAMLRENEHDVEKLDDLATLDSCAQRAASMVRQLLTFARGEEQGTRAAVDMVEVANEVLKIVKETFPRNVEALMTAGPDPWPVKADPTQMHQLLTNLCLNARDAMPEGGTLTVAVEGLVVDDVYASMNVEANPGPYVLLRVEDTGMGIPSAIQERIFEPFFTTKDVGRGTGLGLSTCHAIVRSHGGFIEVMSDIGKGTRFKIFLPADLPTVESDEAVIEEPSATRGTGELVLVVDDEPSVRRVTSRILERYGYRVMTASNGAEAVALFAEHAGAISVVLTDMSMPVMDGPATIVGLQAIDPNVKIIGSSGLDANDKLATAHGAGVVHFVPKPYTAETLLRMIRRVIVA